MTLSIEQDLPEYVLHSILRKLEPHDIARWACVARRWHLIASDESVWKELCSSRFDLSTACDHHGDPCSSFQEAYRKWHISFRMYPSSLVVRVKRCWENLKSWTSMNCPEIAESLRPGASEEDIDFVEEALGWSLPLSDRLLYRFCGGQELPEDFYFDYEYFDEADVPNKPVGLLGGYSFYDHRVNVCLLPLEKVVQLTKYLIPHWELAEVFSKRIIIAASLYSPKFFFLDCKDGSLYVGTRNLETEGEMMRCVPPFSETTNMQDALLSWLEEYCTQLKSGMFSVQNCNGTRSIWLYPEGEPWCTEAVTCGVQVRSSAVFVPEYSDLPEDGDGNYLFSYSVRMCLLPSGDDLFYHPLNSCQLLRRHWIIRENETVIQQVHADAVIGLYPLLKSGGETFTYESCSSFHVTPGSIEGDFTFVPGSKEHPEGGEFYVKVARFNMEMPKFIF